jgi:hypothetical protein
MVIPFFTFKLFTVKRCEIFERISTPFPTQTGGAQGRRFMVLSIFFSVHPFADIRGTVFKLHAVRLASP